MSHRLHCSAKVRLEAEMTEQSLVTRLESLEEEESLFLAAGNLSHLLAPTWVNR